MVNAQFERDTATISILQALDGPGGQRAPVEISDPRGLWNKWIREFREANAALDDAFHAIGLRAVGAPIGTPEWLAGATVAMMAEHKSAGMDNPPKEGGMMEREMGRLANSHHERLEYALRILGFGSKRAADDFAYAVASTTGLMATPFADAVKVAGGELQLPVRESVVQGHHL